MTSMYRGTLISGFVNILLYLNKKANNFGIKNKNLFTSLGLMRIDSGVQKSQAILALLYSGAPRAREARAWAQPIAKVIYSSQKIW